MPEAKGEAPPSPRQVSCVLDVAMGELIQRPGDPNTTYGLALPDNRQYRGLLERLPTEARHRIISPIASEGNKSPSQLWPNGARPRSMG